MSQPTALPSWLIGLIRFVFSSRLARQIWSELFVTSLVSFILFFLIDDLFAGFVSNHLNLNAVLAVVLGSGAISALLKEREPGPPPGIDSSSSVSRAVIVFAVAILGGFLVFLKIASIGRLSVTIALLSTIILISLSWVLIIQQRSEE